MNLVKSTRHKQLSQAWRLDRAILSNRWHSPNKVALKQSDFELTYEELDNLVGAVAGFFKEKLVFGDRLAFYTMNHPLIFVLILAAARTGNIVVPLNWRLSVKELRYQLNLCDPKLIFFGDEFGGDITSLLSGLRECSPIPLSNLTHYASEVEPLADNNACGLDNDLLIVFTSGTTGQPKGARLTQSNFRSNAIMCRHAFTLSREDIVLNILPLFHVGGLNIQPVPVLIEGGTVLISKAFNPSETLDAIAKHQVSQITTVPTVLSAMLSDEAWTTTDLSSLHAIAIGSTDVPISLIKNSHDRGVPVVQIYGSTETSPTAIYQTIDIAMGTVGSIGRCGCNTEILIADSDGKELPDRAVGEIWVKGPNVFNGYWNDEKANRDNLNCGWFKTGDLAFRDENGLFWFKGRTKHVIISGGENIYPAELERLLTGHPDLKDFAIAGVEHRTWGQVPMVFAVAKSESIKSQDILSVFDGSVANFKKPKGVIFMESLPRNALGKLNLEELKNVDI